jgi:hypothetical protein
MYTIIIYIIYTLHIVWIYLPSNLAASTSISQYPFDPIRLFAFLAIYMCISKSVCKCWKKIKKCKCSTWDSFSNFWCQMCTAFRCEVTRAHSCALDAIDSWSRFSCNVFLATEMLLGILGMFLGNWTELGWTWLN